MPFAAGGATDVFGRVIATELQGALGGAFVVENKPGGGGNIGSLQVARSAPDGYTLLLGAAGNMAINPALFPNMAFDPAKDLVPVAALTSSVNVLVVPSSLPVNSVQELIAQAKANPTKFNFGSSGNGGTTHLAGEMFNVMAGTKITHVPYQGSGPAMVDLLAGRVQMMFDNVPSSMRYVASGALRPLGVTGRARLPSMANVPTIQEAGLPGFEATTWFGLYAPEGTPAAVIERLNKAVNTILAKPAMLERIEGLGAQPIPMTPAEFKALQERDARRWADVIRKANITLQ
ncbi:MAG: tripartite tricarboxylate transporter substrate binding protein [Comamonadaceae bacterium]|nr:tripartite tricarboxylate transporter substrate binding protein [Comamonadaceae bacterium]